MALLAWRISTYKRDGLRVFNISTGIIRNLLPLKISRALAHRVPRCTVINMYRIHFSTNVVFNTCLWRTTSKRGEKKYIVCIMYTNNVPCVYIITKGIQTIYCSGLHSMYYFSSRHYTDNCVQREFKFCLSAILLGSIRWFIARIQLFAWQIWRCR